MPTATLSKITEDASADSPVNSQILKCLKCEQKYLLGYDDSEWHRLKDWLRLAEAAIRKDHDLCHEAASIPLEWSGIRRR
jgi:hypothetical protein